MAEQKSVFTISDAEIVFKLHEAALKQVKVPKGGQFINTGVGKERKYDKTFQNKEALYEVGITAVLNDYKNEKDQKLTAKEDELKKIKEANKKILDTATEDCLKQLQTYFKWFAGPDAEKTITKDSIVPFNPDPADAAKPLKIENFAIISVEEDKVNEFREKNPGKPPVIGYKVGFELMYKGT